MAEYESPLEHSKGTRKYRDMVHKSSKAADDKNLPFTFPKKSKIKTSSRKGFECPHCGNIMLGTKFSYMIVCSSCKVLVKVGD